MAENLVPADSSPSEDNLSLLIRSDDSIQMNNKKSKRHTAIVRRMRLLLPILALAVIAVLLTWKSDNAPLAPVPREQVSPQTVSQNELINPKFQSEDKNGQPYSITADKATQNAENMDVLHLQKPVADINMKSGDNITLKATSGIYQQSDKNLNLTGNVIVHHNSGYEIQTEKMNIDVTKQIVTSDQPVTGHGPTADITATGLKVDGNQKTVIFNGPAKLILHKAPKEQTLSSETPK